MERAMHVTRIVKRYAHEVLAGEHDRKWQLGRPRHRRKIVLNGCYTNETGVTELDSRGSECGPGASRGNTVMKLRVPQNTGTLFTTRRSNTF
jgi:hypothetical protein